MISSALFRFNLLSIFMGLVLLSGCGGRDSIQDEPKSYSVHYSKTPAEPLNLTGRNSDRISASGDRFLAIDNGGGVFAWGMNQYLTTIPEGLSDIVMVSASSSHNLALTSDGSVVAWGDAAELPGGLTDEVGLIAIAAANRRSLGLRADGTVIGWGEGMTVPEGLSDVVEIDAYNGHFSALKSDGSIVSWGEYLAHRCFESPCIFSFAATTYNPEIEFRSIFSSPYREIAALSNSGEIYRLGFDETVPIEKIELESTSKIISVSPNRYYYLTLGSNGDVYSWNKESGPLEQRQDFTSGISAVDADDNYGLALTDNGKVFTWKPNLFSNDTFFSLDEMDRQIDVRLISPEMSVRSNGKLNTRIYPTLDIEEKLSELKNIIAIPSKENMGYAITAEGDVHLLASSAGGQIDFRGGTKKIFSGSNIIDIAPSWNGSLALNRDGSAFMFKVNDEGEAEDYVHPSQPELANVKAIAAGGSHYLAVDANGGVLAWGANEHGQIDVPDGLTGVKAVSAGAHHSAALKSDGTVVTWGAFSTFDYLNSRVSEVGPFIPAVTPDGITDVVEIFSAQNHTLALRNSGTVVAWGNNSTGQASVPKGLEDVTAISGSIFSSDALRSDGTVVTWGIQNYTIGMHNNWASDEFVESIKVEATP